MNAQVLTVQSRLPKTLVGIVLALLSVGTATVLMRAATPWLNTPTIALLYLIPVGVSAAFLGLVPGIVAAAGSFLAFDYFFLQPYATLLVSRTQEVLDLVVLLVVAIVVSQLIAQAQTNLNQARSREREAFSLYELGTRLLGVDDFSSIARVTCEQVVSSLRAEHARFVLRESAVTPGVDVSHPAGLPAAASGESAVVAIQGVRQLLGEIAVWRPGEPMRANELDLLRAFAGQAALAVERARFSRAEQRARLLEESDTLKSALLSSVSHELRTPLSTIKAAASSLHVQGIDLNAPEAQQLIEAIDQEADYLNLLVGNLLDMSRIESGALHPQFAWNDLHEILRSVLIRMRTAARLHTVESSLPDDLPLVFVDYFQIEQVLANLLSNSLKYAPEGTTISIAASQSSAQTVRVDVRNQGPPIPERDLERIFEKFYRSSQSQSAKGTGLGLAISKAIVEAHKGTIWASNQQGAPEFSFTLPTSSDFQHQTQES
jgi:two-component system sensor histidine kinase KdpD